VQSLETATATRRHIILLTDGWSTSGQYDQILARMKPTGSRSRRWGLAAGANPFLEQLATQGGGRYYAARTRPASRTSFSRKRSRSLASRSSRKASFPIQTSTSPILRGLEKGLPRLLGYNGTTIKPAAQGVLVTSRDDPLLANGSTDWDGRSPGRPTRRDAGRKTGSGWSGFSRFFSQLVSWTFPGEETGGIEASFETSGDTTGLHVQASSQMVLRAISTRRARS